MSIQNPHITFNTDIMVGMSISWFEHDLQHDLHPGYKGEERAFQSMSSMSSEERRTMSSLSDQETYTSKNSKIQRGGLIAGVTTNEENKIVQIVTELATQTNNLKEKIQTIQGQIEELQQELNEGDLIKISERYELIEKDKIKLQEYIISILKTAPTHWIRLNILLEFQKNYNNLYEFLLNDVIDVNVFDSFTIDILLYQLIQQLNPHSGQDFEKTLIGQELFVSEQLNRYGQGYFVYLLYNPKFDSILFLNNEIITEENYLKTIENNYIIYQFKSNLLEMYVALKVLPSDAGSPAPIIELYQIDPNGQTQPQLLTNFYTPSVKRFFENDLLYQSLLENQTIFCNYLVDIQNANDDIYEQQKLSMKGGTSGIGKNSFSLFSQVETAVKNYFEALWEMLNQQQQGKRVRSQKKNDMIPQQIAEAIGEENENCYNNFIQCNNSMLMSKLFGSASSLQGVGIQNINIVQLLELENYNNLNLNVPVQDDRTNINKKSQFCNLLQKLIGGLDNFLENPSPDSISILINIFKQVSPKEREMLFEKENVNYQQEIKIGMLISILEFVIYLLYLINVDTKGKEVIIEYMNSISFTFEKSIPLLKIIRDQFNSFLENYCVFIMETLGSKKTLTAPQKLNITFFVCIASASFRFCLNRLLNKDTTNQLKKSVFKKEMIKKNYDMMAKTMDLEQIKKMTPGGNLDDLTWTNIIKYITSGTAKFEGGSNFLQKNNIKGNSNFLQELRNNENTSVALKNICDRFENLVDNGQKFYIPNAVNAASKMGELHNEHMCNIAAVMDAQPFCSSTLESLKNGDGLEWGKFSVDISDAPNSKTYNGLNMIYRIQVDTNTNKKGYPVEAYIKVYYQIGDKILINIGNPPIAGQSVEDSIKVSLTGGSSPLKAVECFKTLGTTCMKIATEQFSGNLPNFLNAVMTYDNPKDKTMDQIRQQICNKSVRKSLGDVIIELTGATFNGGYDPKTWKYAGTGAQRLITRPNEGRLTLSNDKPSGGRLLMYILFGKTGINPNCMGGFINNNGGFGVAFRGQPYRGGRKIKKTKKRRENKNKKSKKRIKKQIKKKSKIKKADNK